MGVERKPKMKGKLFQIKPAIPSMKALTATEENCDNQSSI